MPFTLEEMDDFANRYLLLMDARYIKVVVNEKNEAVAFVIAMPDISKGIQKSRGYILPFGIIQILLAGRRSNQLNLLLGCSSSRLPEQGTGYHHGFGHAGIGQEGWTSLHRQSPGNGIKHQGQGRNGVHGWRSIQDLQNLWQSP